MRAWCASALVAMMRPASGASPRVSLRGFPGVTSHQTRSRSSRFMAIKQAPRCAPWPLDPLPAREKVAPAPAEFSRSDLPRSVYAILEAGQLFDAHRPARMEAASGDADLGAEAELAAIGELGRGVVQHDCGIDLVEKFFGRSMIFRHDRIGVV